MIICNRNDQYHLFFCRVNISFPCRLIWHTGIKVFPKVTLLFPLILFAKKNGSEEKQRPA
ncbi:MAG TPA: hypothetical protein DIC22_12930 [Chitinophagaceae bacterium]|nr:hypothetical protein [Chitinophagaceae bacterium]